MSNGVFSFDAVREELDNTLSTTNGNVGSTSSTSASNNNLSSHEENIKTILLAVQELEKKKMITKEWKRETGGIDRQENERERVINEGYHDAAYIEEYHTIRRDFKRLEDRGDEEARSMAVLWYSCVTGEKTISISLENAMECIRFRRDLGTADLEIPVFNKERMGRQIGQNQGATNRTDSNSNSASSPSSPSSSSSQSPNSQLLLQNEDPIDVDSIDYVVLVSIIDEKISPLLKSNYGLSSPKQITDDVTFLYTKEFDCVLRHVLSFAATPATAGAAVGLKDFKITLRLLPLTYYENMKKHLSSKVLSSDEQRLKFVELADGIAEFGNWFVPMTYIGWDVVVDDWDVEDESVRENKQKLNINNSVNPAKFVVKFASNSERKEVWKKYCNIIEALIGGLCEDEEMEVSEKISSKIDKVQRENDIKIYKRLLAFVVSVAVVEVGIYGRLDRAPEYDNAEMRRRWAGRQDRQVVDDDTLMFMKQQVQEKHETLMKDIREMLLNGMRNDFKNFDRSGVENKNSNVRSLMMELERHFELTNMSGKVEEDREKPKNGNADDNCELLKNLLLEDKQILEIDTRQKEAEYVYITDQGDRQCLLCGKFLGDTGHEDSTGHKSRVNDYFSYRLGVLQKRAELDGTVPNANANGSHHMVSVTNNPNSTPFGSAESASIVSSMSSTRSRVESPQGNVNQGSASQSTSARSGTAPKGPFQFFYKGYCLLCVSKKKNPTWLDDSSWEQPTQEMMERHANSGGHKAKVEEYELYKNDKGPKLCTAAHIHPRLFVRCT